MPMELRSSPVLLRRFLLWCFLGVLLAACGKDKAAAPEQLMEGRPFPAMSLAASARNPLAAAEFSGRMLILNVWATWCPPCRKEMPGLERLSRRLDTRRFAVIGLSTDEDEMLASEFLLQNRISFANFHDRGGAFAKRIGMTVYPETFLIAPDGTLVRRVAGLREWDSEAMVAELEQLYRQHHGKIGKTE